MSKFSSEKAIIVDYLKRGYGTLMAPLSKVQPQMPKEQLVYFLKQAVSKKASITVQVNPTTHQNSISEFTGIPYFSPTSTQVIIKTGDNRTTYLLNARDIRHIRLNK
ncbi:hypothetical protein GCM10008932_01600 [Alkalibacterium iburiense]|uniref:Uncharacterized protein n=1 Tax=Alkalibacterium iburiense TaxID=290589 RepID=A0ABP3GTD2_9LACT